MFGSLRQGGVVYILDKTDGVRLKTGEVIYTSAPKPMIGGMPNQQCLDLRVNVDGNTIDYNSIPFSNTIVSYDNGNIVISETKQGLQQDVEAILHNLKQALENIDRYKNNIGQCEEILKTLNPQFARDKERDERLTSLEERFDGVAGKIDKILTLITTK